MLYKRTLAFGIIFEAEAQHNARKGRRPASHSVAQSAVFLRRVRKFGEIALLRRKLLLDAFMQDELRRQEGRGSSI